MLQRITFFEGIRLFERIVFLKEIGMFESIGFLKELECERIVILETI